eukprot:CAMPEP_0172313662 /NCGR_PEP_ID=MMETSP1058-20130122/20700_1 /TAXON_ID=83371 /ORGANISM="Detonula confervacea, Strain CCMP 353" /LENGTH=829 /DNA_ID=CAMNT_0013027355 /DNA_START=191 /DNA_END=2680 /DNA_ORIENTATION=+
MRNRRRRRATEQSCCRAHDHEVTMNYGPRKILLLCMMTFCIGHSMALMSVRPFLHHGHHGKGLSLTSRGHDVCNVHQNRFLNRFGKKAHSYPFISSLNTVKDSEQCSEDDLDGNLDEDGFSTTDTKGSGDIDDDIDTDEYFGRFISEALKEEEMSQNRKPKKGSSNSNTDASPSSDGGDDALSETKRMMEQQQQQIDQLMKLVQQQSRQQLPPPSETNAPNNDRIGADGTPRQRSQQQSPATETQQKSINVAPLKAMLFIDGTWLYYSLNARNSNRDPIIPKFGAGWQNHYKVDWLALPRLICEQIEKQRNSKTSFSGSDRPLEIARAMVFTSAKKETDPNSIRMRMFRDMANANYDVHMMETVGKGEKCVDIQLAVEMLHYATVPNAYDVAILLSGDKDFVPALVRTRQKGKQVCISSMRAGCNRVLYESPHIRDYDVVWLENCLDELIVPISPEERGRSDRAGYASSFTMMKVLRDFVSAAGHEWVSSRDIGQYLKSIEIGDSNMLDELKTGYNGGLRAFLQERACNLFDAKFPDTGTGRGRDEYGFWVRVNSPDSDDTLLQEFKRTNFFTKQEKEFLESYKKEKYMSDDTYYYTSSTANSLDASEGDDSTELDVFDELASPALDYSQLTVVRLRDVCREKGLLVSGKKDVLIDRLEKDRKLEYEVVEKLRREAREASMRSKRTAKKTSRPKAMSTASKPLPSMASGTQMANNVYASALPQLDVGRYRNPRGSSAPADPAAATYLESLIKEYLTASGGAAGSRDIGRYLAANGDSRKGNRSALTELKENHGSLLTFLLSHEDTFVMPDKTQGYGGDTGFPIELIKAS